MASREIVLCHPVHTPIGSHGGSLMGTPAVEPGLFGLGPVPAVRQALDRAGWALGDLDRVEINEVSAVVPLAVSKELGLPLDIVNVDGRAIAHGLVTLCIGGGQGIALALEAA